MSTLPVVPFPHESSVLGTRRAYVSSFVLLSPGLADVGPKSTLETPNALATLRKLRREILSSSISLIPPTLTVPIDRPINFLLMPKQLSRRAFVKPFSTLIVVMLVFWKGPLTEEGLVEEKDVQGDDQRNDHRSQRGSQAMVG